jgi:hypothetical protein
MDGYPDTAGWHCKRTTEQPKTGKINKQAVYLSEQAGALLSLPACVIV